MGLGAMALADLLGSEAQGAGLPGLPHFAPKAKRVIFLFMSGGVSQLESFDPKPMLKKRMGEEMPASLRQGKQPIGMLVTILVGIVAAFIGTAIARALGIPTVTNGIDWLELLVQVVVAAIGVALVSALMGRRRTGLMGRRRSGLLR